MSDNEIKIKLTGKDEASPTLKAAIDRLAQSMEKLNQTQTATAEAAKKTAAAKGQLNTSTINLAAGFTLVKEAGEFVIGAFEKVAAVIERAVDEALQAERANNMLVGALKSTGQFSEEAAEKLDKYVDQVERATGASGETVKQMIAMGVQMGLSAQKAAEMEEAARKLAAATGKDVGEAFSLLQRSLTGQAGALARVLPQVKDLGEAQLRQGSAIDLVNQKLTEQYKLYQGSFAASLDKAKNSVNNVYEAFGKLLIQNPLAQKGVNLFVESMNQLERAFNAANQWILKNQESIESFLAAFGKAALVVGGAVAVFITITGATAALTAAVTALGAAFTFLMSPLGLITLAVAGLTLAFQKWPFLFDYIQSAAKAAFSGFLTIIEKLLSAVAAVTSVFDKDMSASISKARQSVAEFSENMATSAVQSYEAGEQMRIYGTKAEDANTKALNTTEEVTAAQLKLNTQVKETAKSFGDYSIGTESQRLALQGQAQDREKDKKDFEQYLEAKKRLAVSNEQEQNRIIAEVRAKELEGSGSTGVEAKADATIQKEKQKQAELEVLHQQQLIDDIEFEAAMAASRQRAMQADLQAEQAHRMEKANIMGESEEAFAERLALSEERYQAEQEIRNARYEQEQLTEQERIAAEDEARMVHNQQVRDMEDAHWNAVAAREEVSGATITATRNKWFREQEKNQAQAIKNFASGVNMMVSIQTAMNQTFAQLGDALIKNQKITASKMVGVFLEMLGRQVQQKGFGDLVMGIFPPNPVQLAVGAAEVAAGTAIGRLGVSMQGGQGDEGIDDIPQPLSGKSFVVSGGERIVQPSANRDLKEFLAKEKGANGSSGPTNVYITIQGSIKQEDARSAVDMMIEELRKASERGVPIISEKGVVKNGI